MTLKDSATQNKLGQNKEVIRLSSDDEISKTKERRMAPHAIEFEKS